MLAGVSVVPARRHDPGIFAGKVALLWFWNRGLVPGVTLIDGISQGILCDKLLSAVLPVIVIRTAEQDANTEVDVDQTTRDDLTVDNDAGSDVHRTSPLVHVLVLVIDDIGIVERTPAAQQGTAIPDFFVSGQSFVHEVEQVIVQRHDPLHELHILHEPDEIVGKDLYGSRRTDSPRIERGRMHMPFLHETEHLARAVADGKCLAIKLAREWIQRRHDVCNGSISVNARMGGFFALRFAPHARIGFFDHLLAEIHADVVVLENVVVEHVLRGLTEVQDPFAERRRLDAESHVLSVDSASCVVVAADPADAAGNEVRIARVLVFHEYAVTSEYGRRAVALGHLLILEIDLREDAEAADDPRDRVPVHLDKTFGLRQNGFSGRDHRGHDGLLRLSFTRSYPVVNRVPR